MKTYSIGNTPVKKTINYLSRSKTEKANRVFLKLIQKVVPDCQSARMCSTWPVNFNSNTQVIEKAGIKICYEKYLLRENTYLFAIIAN